MGRLGIDCLYIYWYIILITAYRPGLCILYAGSQWFSTAEITSCYSVCPHGPTMLNKQTNNKTNLVQIKTSTFQMRPFSHFRHILQLDLTWSLTLVHDLWLHEQMKLHTYQLTKFGSNRTSTFQMRLFSAYLTTWPHMTFGCMNKWSFTHIN